MTRKLSKTKSNWIVTAHPDDETIFFAGLLMQQRSKPWHLICVTDGNADGRGGMRRDELHRAAKSLGIKQVTVVGQPDLFEKRLDIEALRQSLRELPAPSRIFTHGPLGEYGHPHHQDVSYAVHMEFSKKCEVYSVAHNCYPEMIVKLKKVDFQRKAKILSTTFFGETQRFFQMLPANWCEGFVRVSAREVEILYLHLTGQRRLAAKELKTHQWLAPYLEDLFGRQIPRPF